MTKLKTYFCFILLAVFGVVGGCAGIGDYIGDTEEKVSKANVKFEKVVSLYEDKIRPQAKKFIERADKDYELYFGDNVEALESDNGIQDLVYTNYWDQLNEDQKQNLTELDKRIKESYKEYKELREQAVKLDKTIQEKKEDVDEFFASVNHVLDKMEELNSKARFAKSSVKEISKILIQTYD